MVYYIKRQKISTISVAMASPTESKSGNVSVAKTMTSLDEKMITDRKESMTDCFEQLIVVQTKLDDLYRAGINKAKESDTIKVVKNSIYDVKRKSKIRPVCNCYKYNYRHGTIARVDIELEKFDKKTVIHKPEGFNLEIIAKWDKFDLHAYSTKFPRISWQIYHQCHDIGKHCVIIREADPYPIDRVCVAEQGVYYLARPTN
jgi:hypothetical protein